MTVIGKPAALAFWKDLKAVLLISWRGLWENRLFSKAAALSYSSLIALGPLVAVVVILSSSFIRTDAETQIKRALLFIAPSLQELVTLEESGEEASEMSTALDALLSQIVEGAESMINQVNTSGSKAFGALGALILIWVVIQLLTSVETTLNQIWGVHQGRPWSQRIVFYWTFVSLGALLGLGSTALLSASNLASMTDWVPFGKGMDSFILSISPLLSFLMLVLLLALFYRFFPNTGVSIHAALTGSFATSGLLILNNYLSILYVHRVLSFQSLYGSVGIIPVLMIGLYFFWVLILLGGQLTFAIQNVGFLGAQTAWNAVSPVAREATTLSAFLQIARRFHECRPAPTIHEISTALRVPVNILNESLAVLENLDWIIRIDMDDAKGEVEETGFRPSRPLDSYSLSKFHAGARHLGDSGLIGNLETADPLVRRYLNAMRGHESDRFLGTNLESLLDGEREATAQP